MRTPREQQTVTCADIDDLISSANERLLHAPVALDHLERCAGCRFLVRALEEIEPSEPSAGRFDAIESAITANLRPIRPLAPPGTFLFASIAIITGAVAVGAMLAGTNVRTALLAPERIAVLAAATTGALTLAVSMIRQMTPGRKLVVDPASLAVAVLLTTLLVIAFAFRPNQETHFIANGLACMQKGITVSLLAGSLLVLLFRRAAACSRKLFGAVGGGFAGLAGLVVLDLICPNGNVRHILVWHWSEVLICASVGTLLFAAVDAYRSRRVEQA